MHHSSPQVSQLNFSQSWAWGWENMSEHSASPAMQDLPRRSISLLPHWVMSCTSQRRWAAGRIVARAWNWMYQGNPHPTNQVRDSLGGPPTSHWELLTCRSLQVTCEHPQYTLPHTPSPYGLFPVHTPNSSKNKLLQKASEHMQKVQFHGPERDFLWESKGKVVSTQRGTMQDGEKFKNSATRGRKMKQAYPQKVWESLRIPNRAEGSYFTPEVCR